MDITCPHCHLTLESDSSLAGSVVTCPQCNQDFPVPKIVDAGPAPMAILSTSAKPTNVWKWIAFGIALVAAFALGVIFASFFPMLNRASVSTPAMQSARKPRPSVNPLPKDRPDEESLRWLLSCENANFTEIMRFPEENKGKDCYVEGKIFIVRYPDPSEKNHRGNVWVHQDGSMKKDWCIVFDDERTILPEGNMLKGDTVCAWGTFEEVVQQSVDRTPVLIARWISGESSWLINSDAHDALRSLEQSKRNGLPPGGAGSFGSRLWGN